MNDPALRTAIVTVAGVAAALAVLAAVGFGLRPAAGVVVGGALATLNLVLFIRMTQAFIAQRGRTAPWAVVAVLKLLGLFACVLVVLRSGTVQALSLAVGYAALPIGITLSTVLRKPTQGPPDDRQAPPSPSSDRGVAAPPTDVVDSARR